MKGPPCWLYPSSMPPWSRQAAQSTVLHLLSLSKKCSFADDQMPERKSRHTDNGAAERDEATATEQPAAAHTTATRGRGTKRPRRVVSPVQAPAQTGAESQAKRTKRSSAVWSVLAKDSFFQAVCDHGRDFDRIQAYMARQGRAEDSSQASKNKDQVRHMYYRTWTKVQKMFLRGGTLHELRRGGKASDSSSNAAAAAAAAMAAANAASSAAAAMATAAVSTSEPSPEATRPVDEANNTSSPTNSDKQSQGDHDGSSSPSTVNGVSASTTAAPVSTAAASIVTTNVPTTVPGTKTAVAAAAAAAA
eukprot:scpid104367/ scgid34722/ Protein cramped-like; Hematological and neurological expressed 1-like protein